MPENETKQETQVNPLELKIAELEKKLSELIKPAEKPIEDKSLDEKVKLDKETKQKEDHDVKKLEDAISFNLTHESFLKANEGILPEDAQEIFNQAAKENYSSAIQKSNAIKSALVQSFFSQQSNLDMLTASQRQTIENHFKLTKNAKEEKAQEIFQSIFEPCIETIKRVKKAEEIAKANKGYDTGSDLEKQYEKMLFEKSSKHYLRGN